MLPERVLHLLQIQHGLVADHQLRLVEPDRARRRRIRRHPELERVGPRVLRHEVVPRTGEQRLMHAVLDAGPTGTLWGKSAASHWGFSRFRRFPPHVAIRHGCRHEGPRIAQLHVVRTLTDEMATTHLGIPIARPEETVLWLAGMWTHRLGHELALPVLERTLDQAWRQGLIGGDEIHALAERAGGRGRSGIVILRKSLVTRPPDYTPAGSALEERFESLLPPHVCADLDRQVRIDSGRKIQIVDYELTCWPLVVEINGEFAHSSLTARSDDDARYERLLAAGQSVVVFWEHDIWHDATTVRNEMLRLHRSPDTEPTVHRPTPPPWGW